MTRDKRYAEDVSRFASTWGRVYRCLTPDESGDVMLNIDGEKVRGYWVYGYFVFTDRPYIIGGMNVDELCEHPKRYEIVNMEGLINRCCGIFATSGNITPKVLWDNDVVKVSTYKNKKHILTGRIKYDCLRMEWIVAEMDDSLKPTGLYQPMDAIHFEYEFVGAYLDMKYKEEKI